MPESNARKNRKTPKVLVYVLGSLGDSIVAIPALRALRRHFAEAEIVVLQNLSSKTRVLAADVLPDELVDRYLSYHSRPGRFAQVLEYLGLWRKLRRERFDFGAYLLATNRGRRSVLRDRLFFRSCGIGILYGFQADTLKEPNLSDVDRSQFRAKHEAVVKLDRLERDGIASVRSLDLRQPQIFPSAEDLEVVDEWLEARRLDRDVPLFSLAPGCNQDVNRWPLERFSELGRILSSRVPCELLVTGGPSDFEMGERLIERWGSGINAAGKFSVRRSAALLSRCRIHIGLDTGTTHLAAAVGTRCFTIFSGRNDQGSWHPLGMGHSVVFHPVACAPCRSFICTVPTHPCLSEMSSQEVGRHLLEFIEHLHETEDRENQMIVM